MRPQFIYLDLGNVIVLFDHAKAWQQMADLAAVSYTHLTLPTNREV